MCWLWVSLRLLPDIQNAGEFLCDLKVRVRVEMTVGSKRGLYLLMPKALLKEQGAFAHVDKQGSMGMSNKIQTFGFSPPFPCQYAG